MLVSERRLVTHLVALPIKGILSSGSYWTVTDQVGETWSFPNEHRSWRCPSCFPLSVARSVRMVRVRSGPMFFFFLIDCTLRFRSVPLHKIGGFCSSFFIYQKSIPPWIKHSNCFLPFPAPYTVLPFRYRSSSSSNSRRWPLVNTSTPAALYRPAIIPNYSRVGRQDGRGKSLSGEVVWWSRRRPNQISPNKGMAV